MALTGGNEVYSDYVSLTKRSLELCLENNKCFCEINKN